MKLTTPSPAGRPAMATLRPFLAAALLAAATGAMAQYKIVGPDGQVTYTDKPPTASAVRSGGGSTSGSGAGALPYAVRQAASRYPVSLYAAKGCVPCDQARQWLHDHAIPYSEYSVDTNDDIGQLQQRFGDSNVPVVTIGSQTVRGFSSGDLQSYADAAGYPKLSSLPGYTWPAAVPLAPRRAAPTAATAPAASGATSNVTLPPPSKSGIQF